MSEDDLSNVVMRERSIFPPSTISPEARRLLSFSAAASRPPWPAPERVEEWQALIETNAAFWASEFAREIDSSVSIDTVDIGGVECHSCLPARPVFPEESVYLFVHGGAFVNGGGPFAKLSAARIATALGMRTISIDYRMPPQHPFPAGLDDCFAVYEALLAEWATNIFLAGSSAGEISLPH